MIMHTLRKGRQPHPGIRSRYARKRHSSRYGIVRFTYFESNATGRKALHCFRNMSAPDVVRHYMTPIWEMALDSNNKRITQQNIRKQLLTVKELKVLHGLRVLMAFIELPLTRMY